LPARIGCGRSSGSPRLRISPAGDFTEEQKSTIRSKGRLEEPSAYSDRPYLTTRTFWESGESLRVLKDEIAIDCPMRLLHGQMDADVPWEVSMTIAQRVRSADVQTFLIKDGDHRLSRDRDIALLIRTVDGLLEAL
jgi:pimeloyl-ACP methyl ester carboxylesterase